VYYLINIVTVSTTALFSSSLLFSIMTSISSNLTTVKCPEDSFQSPEAALSNPELLNLLRSAVKSKTLIAFLDYDGTLSPIVTHPELAFISETTRNLLYELPQAGIKTVVITGRSMTRIQKFCAPQTISSESSTMSATSFSSFNQSNPLFFCASHGFDIHGPLEINYQPYPEYILHLQKAKDAMTKALDGIENVVIEDNKYSISVHYRTVDVSLHASTIEIAQKAALGSLSSKRRPSALAQIVEEDVDGLPKWLSPPINSPRVALEMRAGKLVIECRPAPEIPWHKGKALAWMMTNVFSQDDLTVLVIGDDLTDEDTFSEVLSLEASHKISSAIPIIVSETLLTRPTSAKWLLKSPEEVCKLLSLLLSS
jgi:HAD superfamily hydrolase (TIGR01484 family)